ncbi:MAG: DUF3048 domain-containing protein [Clostridia bacterium]|nr:DUF3048 domain-containing protein [Clostridia bacterium]
MKKTILLLVAALLLCCLTAGALAESEGVMRISLQVTAPPDADTQLVDEFLETQAAAQKDAWTQAILESGAQDVQSDGGNYTFTLCAYDPDVKALGAYQKAEDKAAWRQNMVSNVSSHRLQMTLAFEEDGSVSKKETQRFINAVKQAAKSAKNAWIGKDMTSAAADLFFLAPTQDKKPTAASLVSPAEAFESFRDEHPVLSQYAETPWACLFYVQRNIKVSVKDGPHAMALTWDGADPSRLLSQAYNTVSTELSGKTRAERPEMSALPGLLEQELAAGAFKMKTGRLVKQSAVIDLDELGKGVYPAQYVRYLESFTYETTLGRVLQDYDLLPDEATQAFPKTGKLTVAPAKGRTVAVSIPEEGLSAYVQLRDADTDVIVSDAFIAAGKNVNMKVTEGIYYVQYATGTAWYGNEHLFGLTGTYAASDEFIIGKKKLSLQVMRDQEGIVLHPADQADFAATEDRSVHVKGVLAADVPLGTYPENNPVIPGVSPLTGMPASGEAYTPIQIVLDNAEEAYPHWGISQADIIFQVPNAGEGATKLLGLFADHYPEEAGPVRSGRASMLPSAMSFQAAFAFAGPPAVKDKNIDIEALMSTWKMASTHRVYNLLQNNGFATRRPGLIKSHDMTCYVKQIHENLVSKGVVFEERPFLFADTPREDGQVANVVKVLHHGESIETASNSASRAVFVYDAEQGAYSRRNSSGMYLDRDTGENVQFANVIILRTKLSYERNYVFLKNHLVGSGAIDVFQSGRYLHGAWVRDSVSSRLVLVDDQGRELEMQRGKTFIVITNEITEVIFSE